MATVGGSVAVAPARRSRGSGRGAVGILFAPVTLLVVLFLGPMVIMAAMSLLKFPPNTASGYTFSHYVDVLTNPLNLKIAWTTFWIATIAMVIMLAISIPLAYYMVFRAGKWELFLLLALVLADELAPVVKIYAWQVILGRNGILNWLIPGPPRSWLLFSSFAVIVTLAATYITYTTIPIYAAMKAIDASMFESAIDLGAGWWVQARRILIPLAAPGIFIAMILVYIPMLTDFVTADIVGGTGSYMMGQRVRDLILSAGDWGAGSALNLVLLTLSVVFSLLAYKLARLNRIQT
ncbi:MAG: ABC transporter permease [Actinomycetota bacterium]|jgi:spermidine/putrescine transport system permease protein